MPINRLIWISFTLLAIIFFSVGCIMLHRLRVYFKDFYKEYGKRLWVANVVLTFPLTFRAILDALNQDAAWYKWWVQGNLYRLTTYNVVIFTLGTYLPALAQITSLVFGFVRQKQQVKLFKHYDEGSARRKSDAEPDSALRDRSNENSLASDNTFNDGKSSSNSFFDPPIENYRFYYQGGQNLGYPTQTGFYMKQRRTYAEDTDELRASNMDH